MNTLQKIVVGIMAVAIVVVGVHSFGSVKSLGDATVSNFPTWYYNGIVIGPQNTLLTQMTFGTCSITGTASVADRATTSGSCVAAGAGVGDKIFIEQPSVGSNGAYPVIAATVTTAGTITTVLQNQTGGTVAPNGGSITGVYWMALR